jgi:flagellar protein FlaG
MDISSISNSGTALALPTAPQGNVSPAVAQPQLPTLQAPSGQSQPVPSQAAPDRAQVEEAVAKVKQKIQVASNNSLDFSIDDATGKMVVRITDKASGELIRQIPSQEMLDIARSIDRLQGILVKQKV